MEQSLVLRRAAISMRGYLGRMVALIGISCVLWLFLPFTNSYSQMTIDVLHPLAHSLTKAGKRYCRLMAQKHLYRVLMQSLRQFEGGKWIDVQIGQLLHDSQILYERGLTQPSQEQLDRARQQRPAPAS